MRRFMAFKHNCRRLHPINLCPPDYAPPKTKYLSTFRVEVEDKLVGTRWDPQRFAPPPGSPSSQSTLCGDGSIPSFEGTTDEQLEKKLERPSLRLRTSYHTTDASTMTDPCGDIEIAQAICTNSLPLHVAGNARMPCLAHSRFRAEQSTRTSSSKLPAANEVSKGGVNEQIATMSANSDLDCSSPETTSQKFVNALTISLEKLDVTTDERVLKMDPLDLLAEDVVRTREGDFSEHPNSVVNNHLSPNGKKDEKQDENTPSLTPSARYTWNPTKPSCGGCSKHFEITAEEVVFECLFPTCGLRVCPECARLLTLNQAEGGFWGNVGELKEYCVIKKAAEKGDTEAVKVVEDREKRVQSGLSLLKRIRKRHAERREFSDRWINDNNWGPRFPHYDTKWHY
ncbi:hypothetical protein RUND412_000698 [Rhizina undulata]